MPKDYMDKFEAREAKKSARRKKLRERRRKELARKRAKSQKPKEAGVSDLIDKSRSEYAKFLEEKKKYAKSKERPKLNLKAPPPKPPKTEQPVRTEKTGSTLLALLRGGKPKSEEKPKTEEKPKSKKKKSKTKKKSKKQVRYLMSEGSPLRDKQKDILRRELRSGKVKTK